MESGFGDDFVQENKRDSLDAYENEGGIPDVDGHNTNHHPQYNGDANPTNNLNGEDHDHQGNYEVGGDYAHGGVDGTSGGHVGGNPDMMNDYNYPSPAQQGDYDRADMEVDSSQQYPPAQHEDAGHYLRDNQDPNLHFGGQQDIEFGHNEHPHPYANHQQQQQQNHEQIPDAIDPQPHDEGNIGIGYHHHHHQEQQPQSPPISEMPSGDNDHQRFAAGDTTAAQVTHGEEMTSHDDQRMAPTTSGESGATPTVTPSQASPPAAPTSTSTPKSLKQKLSQSKVSFCFLHF